MRLSHSSLLAIAALLAGANDAASDQCACIANKVRYNEGELACLKLPSGPRLARCEKVLNNTSWKILHEGCDETSALPASSLMAVLANDANAPNKQPPLHICAVTRQPAAFD